MFGDVFSRLAAAKEEVSKGRAAAPGLQIVAFNDTNDLLTWHIPPWYAVSGADVGQAQTNVNFVNVFVQNTAKLLIIESPSPAHGNYFKNPSVRDVIACGAHGTPIKCAGK